MQTTDAGAIVAPPAKQQIEALRFGQLVMETQQLKLWYAERDVLKGISVPIIQGKVTAVVGPSGCGKTTLLRSLNRLTDLSSNCRTEGRILLDGDDCLSMDPILLRRRVGMVFQRPNPFPLSIRENVLYGVRAQGRTKSRYDEIVEASLRKAVIWEEVKDRLNENALNLSGGQQQRVCIARTLAVTPEVVLMDEPAASLDPKSTLKLEESMLAMRGDYTVVAVTHELSQARRVSDYMAFIYEGRLVEFGETSQLFENPREEATRDYLSGGLVTEIEEGQDEAAAN